LEFRRVLFRSLMAPEHAELSLQAAKESIVLLKNEKQQLPLSKQLGSVAVVGPLADVVYRDWYAGTLPYKVSVLDAVKSKLDNASVSFASSNDHVKLSSGARGSFTVDEDQDQKLKLVDSSQQATVFELKIGRAHV